MFTRVRQRHGRHRLAAYLHNYPPHLLTLFLMLLGSITYIGGLLARPNLSLSEQINPAATLATTHIVQPERALTQTFAIKDSSAVAGLAIKYDAATTHTDTAMQAVIAYENTPVHTIKGPLAQFTNPPRYLFQSEDPQTERQFFNTWILLQFAPLPPAPKPYAVTLTFSKPVAVPVEHDGSIYGAGEARYENKSLRGDISFSLFQSHTLAERLSRLLTTAPHALKLLLIVASSLLLGISYQVVQRVRRGTNALPDHPLMLFLLLAIIFTLPVYYDMRHWGEGDWTEVVTHYAAARHSFAAAQFPLWTPYFCGGVPLWANPQTYWASLTFILTLLTNDIVGTKLALTVYCFLGLWGMSLLTKTLGIRYPASLVPPIVFICTGFFVTHIAVGHLLWLTIAWIPFLLHFFVQSLRQGKLAHILYAAIFYLLLIIEGQTYFFFYIGLLLGALSVAAFVWYPPRRRKIVSTVLIFLLLTLGLGAIKLIPMWSFVQQYDNALENSAPLPWKYLKTMLLTRPGAVMHQTLPSPWWEMLLYVGYAPLLLVLVAAGDAFRRKKWLVIFFLGVGTAALVTSVLPVQYNMLEYLPIFSQLRSHQRILVITMLAISVLAGWGVQSGARYFSSRTLELLGVTIALLIFFDLTRAASLPFSAAFTLTPFPSNPAASFTMKESRTDVGYHTVQAGAGAYNYCPPHLQPWNRNAHIITENEPDYKGEVYSQRAATVRLLAFTPNRLEVQARDIPATGDTLFVNQKYAPGWSSSGAQQVFSDQGRLAIAITPADEGKSITLRYVPQSVVLGGIISFLTCVVVGGITWYRRR